MLWVGTCVTPGYPVAKFAKSLDWVRGVKPFVLTVDAERQKTLKNVDPSFICLQDGQFLDWLPTEDGDLVMLCDADCVIQRDLHDLERARFAAYDNNTVGMEWNAGVGDNLADEFHRLAPLVRDNPLGDLLRTVPCYNGGVIVARPETWRRIQIEYDVTWRHYRKLFGNPRCCQWLLNLTIENLGIHVDRLGPAVHTHGHFAQAWTPDHSRGLQDVVYYKGGPVFLRHKL